VGENINTNRTTITGRDRKEWGREEVGQICGYRNWIETAKDEERICR
jgi:hypothetical protein